MQFKFCLEADTAFSTPLLYHLHCTHAEVSLDKTRNPMAATLGAGSPTWNQSVAASQWFNSCVNLKYRKHMNK